MRPKSIVSFERIYLVSLLVLFVQHVVGFFLAGGIFSQVTGETGVPAEFGATFGAIMTIWMVFSVILSIGFPLLFMWLASRQRQEFAKWVLLVISILSVINWLLSLAVMLLMLPLEVMSVAWGGDLQGTQFVIMAIDAIAEGLGIFALIHLFRYDAVVWFRTRHPGASADVFR